MAADHLQFLKDKFINDFQEAVGEFNELPLRPHFEEISEVLHQKRIISSTPIAMKKSLYDLKFALADCIMLAEKERDHKIQNKRSLLGAHSVKGHWFLHWKGKKLLRNIKRELLRDMSGDSAADAPSSSGLVRVHQPTDFPDFDASKIHGFRDHLKNIEALLFEAPDINSVRVIGIVGMGGSGKSALAQMVFHSPSVQESFSPMLWVELPNSCLNPESIVFAILECLTSDFSGYGSAYNLDELLDNMHNLLLNRKYLIVLDNVWQETD